MAAQVAKIKLSEKYAGSRFQYFRKFIQGRSFVLTQQRQQSEAIAYALQAIAPAAGGSWDEAAVKAAFATSELTDRCITAMSPDEVKRLVAETLAQMGSTPKAAASGRLYAAIDAYLADYRARVKPSRYQRENTALATYKHFQADCELATIDADKLRETVNHFRQRPNTAFGSPMATATVQTTVKAIKAFFDWCDSLDKWIAPRRFEKLFRVRYASLRTPLEVKRDGGGVQTFTVTELVDLYKVATRRQRLYIALALNIGETAQGFASLLKDDLIRDGNRWVIDRNRGKTGVRGVYPLWDETRELLAAEMNQTPSQPLLLLTMDGNALVTFNSKSRIDTVSKTWANLRKKAPNVRPLGHKYVRKTGASLLAQLTGSERIAELYLSHTGDTVAKKHYLAKDFSHLADGLTKLRAQLAPMFAAATEGKAAVSKAG